MRKASAQCGRVGKSAPSHYPNQCWNIVNSNLKDKFQLNLKQNSYIFIQENAFENVICEMASILSQPQCVKVWFPPARCPPLTCVSVFRLSMTSFSFSSSFSLSFSSFSSFFCSSTLSFSIFSGICSSSSSWKKYALTYCGWVMSSIMSLINSSGHGLPSVQYKPLFELMLAVYFRF